MVKEGRPRAGSLAFWPRVRARRIYPHISVYPETDKVKVLGFAGYKTGMAHAILLDNKKGSPTFGQEISVPVTVLDCPPLKVLGLRVYESTIKGLRALNEAWIKDLPKDLTRKVKLKNLKTEERLADIENNANKISKVRLIVSTQPRLSGIGKKKPEVFEIEIGGKDVKEKLEFAKQLLGKEINAADVLKEGELVDVVAVTKGKGTAGPVKRFGIKIQSRHAKQKRRHVGSLGQERPGKVRWTLPMAGQLGMQRRTELNKRILKIGDGSEVTPKSGFKGYGVVKSKYVLVEGSVPGPKKRLVMFRPSIRPSKVKLLLPEIKEIVKE
jgi:large subunit ribosomal protein L3